MDKDYIGEEVFKMAVETLKINFTLMRQELIKYLNNMYIDDDGILQNIQDPSEYTNKMDELSNDAYELIQFIASYKMLKKNRE